ncbi:hypothetical protein Hsc_2544 [Herbaspirillum seropedicae]|nr:hypothetical protein Hsc_2544 [Herbaspirillum seropedicae]
MDGEAAMVAGPGRSTLAAGARRCRLCGGGYPDLGGGQRLRAGQETVYGHASGRGPWRRLQRRRDGQWFDAHDSLPSRCSRFTEISPSWRPLGVNLLTSAPVDPSSKT